MRSVTLAFSTLCLVATVSSCAKTQSELPEGGPKSSPPVAGGQWVGDVETGSAGRTSWGGFPGGSDSPEPDHGPETPVKGPPPRPDACPSDPATIVAGTPCGVTRLCQWRRNGPCPPNPDILWQCYEDRWLRSAPAILCHPPNDEDAGTN